MAPLARWLLTTNRCRLWLTVATVLTVPTLARRVLPIGRCRIMAGVRILRVCWFLVLTGFTLLTGPFSGLIMWFRKVLLMGIERILFA